ncbi:MAG: guanylate kinase [Pseudomonadota bacterium]|uniref:Guanylate kinase n=1 Tax=Gallaecimonas pentaromativorans TaxID=584787 RepID=A0A3N1P5F8_9GAMM|nr:guanylate kinase [Gallaecimonas pentaromativorans]MED5525649.1 guanylate kinase [Pseudomonadota bacterium]ROQ21950.1 guanylate kinase [Gallaecimonas pentaromativorans]
MRRGNLFIVSAPSGAGKSSLIKALLERHSLDNSMAVSVSHTTRATRPGEQHGVHYHFVSVDDFKALINQDAFFEWAEVFGNFYGTSRLAVEQQLENGIDVFLDIDWQGARQVREMMPEAIGIFILPPSREELERRLVGRGQDSSETIAKRMNEAVSEMSHFDEYDYLLINDDFETTLDRFRSVVLAARQSLDNQRQANTTLLDALLAVK